MAKGQVGWGIAGQRLTLDPRPRPAATLAPPQLEIATRERVSGNLVYEMPYNHMLPYCLRMTWDRPDTRTCDMFQHLETPLMPVGLIRFEFQLTLPDSLPAPTLSPLFFSLQSVPDGRSPSLGRALSDTRAVLVELQ